MGASQPYYQLDDFQLYQAARAFRRRVYGLLRKLPPEEKAALVPQLRRAALSVSNNIAEGHGRWHFQECIRFCLIARGSVAEVIDDLNVCADEGYPVADLQWLKDEAYALIVKINSYIAYLRRTQRGARLMAEPAEQASSPHSPLHHSTTPPQ